MIFKAYISKDEKSKLWTLYLIEMQSQTFDILDQAISFHAISRALETLYHQMCTSDYFIIRGMSGLHIAYEFDDTKFFIPSEI